MLAGRCGIYHVSREGKCCCEKYNSEYAGACGGGGAGRAAAPPLFGTPIQPPLFALKRKIIKIKKRLETHPRQLFCSNGRMEGVPRR